MASLRHPTRQFPFYRRTIFPLVAAVLLVLPGCRKTLKVDDPQLKPIQDILETNLPPGTSEGAVSHFLATRKYPVEATDKPGTIVAIIRPHGTDNPAPVAARVTFYFDANGKLNTYEIVRASNVPLPE